MSVENNIPTGWIGNALGKVSKVQTGPFGSQLLNEQYITGGTPVVTVEHIVDFKIMDFDYPSVTDEDKNRLSKYLLKEGDIIFTRVGSVDLSAYVDKKQDGWMFSSRMLSVRPNNEIDSKFLSYFFRQDSFRKYIYRISVGATMPSINTSILKSIPISYPSKIEQKAIANILTAFDDKIELLQAQNITLEATAQTIFKEWFGKYQIGDELPEDWGSFQMNQLVKTINGYSYTGKELAEESNEALVTLKSFDRNGGFQTRGFKPFKGNPKDTQEVQIGDLVVAHTDLTQDAEVLGNPAFIFDNGGFDKMYITMDLVKVVSIHKDISSSFLYYLMKDRAFKGHCVGYSNGTTVLHLSKKAIPEYQVFLPLNFEKVKEFSELANATTNKISLNKDEIKYLKQTRDTLLPKLMSGDLRVDKFKEKVV
jgi:type I restriction enzyme S subunit